MRAVCRVGLYFVPVWFVSAVVSLTEDLLAALLMWSIKLQVLVGALMSGMRLQCHTWPEHVMCLCIWVWWALGVVVLPVWYVLCHGHACDDRSWPPRLLSTVLRLLFYETDLSANWTHMGHVCQSVLLHGPAPHWSQVISRSEIDPASAQHRIRKLGRRSALHPWGRGTSWFHSVGRRCHRGEPRRRATWMWSPRAAAGGRWLLWAVRGIMVRYARNFSNFDR